MPTDPFPVESSTSSGVTPERRASSLQRAPHSRTASGAPHADGDASDSGATARDDLAPRRDKAGGKSFLRRLKKLIPSLGSTTVQEDDEPRQNEPAAYDDCAQTLSSAISLGDDNGGGAADHRGASSDCGGDTAGTATTGHGRADTPANPNEGEDDEGEDDGCYYLAEDGETYYAHGSGTVSPREALTGVGGLAVPPELLHVALRGKAAKPLLGEEAKARRALQEDVLYVLADMGRMYRGFARHAAAAGGGGESPSKGDGGKALRRAARQMEKDCAKGAAAIEAEWRREGHDMARELRAVLAAERKARK